MLPTYNNVTLFGIVSMIFKMGAFIFKFYRNLFPAPFLTEYFSFPFTIRKFRFYCFYNKAQLFAE